MTSVGSHNYRTSAIKTVVNSSEADELYKNKVYTKNQPALEKVRKYILENAEFLFAEEVENSPSEDLKEFVVVFFQNKGNYDREDRYADLVCKFLITALGGRILFGERPIADYQRRIVKETIQKWIESKAGTEQPKHMDEISYHGCLLEACSAEILLRKKVYQQIDKLVIDQEDKLTLQRFFELLPPVIAFDRKKMKDYSEIKPSSQGKYDQELENVINRLMGTFFELFNSEIKNAFTESKRQELSGAIDNFLNTAELVVLAKNDKNKYEDALCVVKELEQACETIQENLTELQDMLASIDASNEDLGTSNEKSIETVSSQKIEDLNRKISSKKQELEATQKELTEKKNDKDQARMEMLSSEKYQSENYDPSKAESLEKIQNLLPELYSVMKTYFEDAKKVSDAKRSWFDKLLCCHLNW